MKVSEFLELSDRERDAIVAEKVMGWKDKSVQVGNLGRYPIWYSPEHNYTHFGQILQFTTSWEGMRLVVERMSDNGFAWEISHDLISPCVAFYHIGEKESTKYVGNWRHPVVLQASIAALLALGELEVEG